MEKGSVARIVLALAAIAVLVVGVLVCLDMQGKAHWGLVYEANGHRVILVERDSAADLAGLRAGQTLTAIGLLPVGQSPPSINGLMPVSLRQGASTEVRWMIQPAAGLPWSVVIALVAAAALWLAGSIVGIAGPPRPDAQSFAGFALLAALALCCASAQDPPNQATQWLLAPAAFGALICYVRLQHALIAAEQNPITPKTGHVRIGLRVRTHAPQGHANPTPGQTALVPRADAADDPGRGARLSIDRDLLLSAQALLVMALLLLVPHLLGAAGRPLAILAALEMPIMLIAAHALAIGQLGPDTPAPTRRRVRLAALIGVAAWLPALLIGWAPPVAGLLGPGYISPISPYLGAAGLLAIAITYPAIVTRGDLFALEAAVRRVGVSLVAGGALLGLVLLVLHGIDSVAHPSEDERLGLGAILGLAALPAFEPIRRRLQAALDRRLAEGDIDFGSALDAIGDELLQTLDEEAIAGVLARYAAPLLGITSIQPWLRGAGGHWRHFTGNAHDGHPPVLLPALLGTGSHALIPRTNETLSAGIPVSSLLDALLRADQPFAPPPGVAPAGIVLCVPVHLGDELRGLLLLGSRRSQDPYRRRERDALVLLAHQVAASLQLVDRMAELRTRNAELAQLTGRLARAREEERKHLSRELHDDVAQDLVAITRQLRRHQQTALPEAIWQDMIAQAQEALTAIRRICNDLRPAILDMGLTIALRELVDRLPHLPRPLRVHLEVEGAETRLDEEREFALYRVTQEALANVIKHADATEVIITVRFDPAITAVEIRDNGHGFAVPARLEEIGGDHLGLLGMRERLAGMGGGICVESVPGEGTVVRAEIPS